VNFVSSKSLENIENVSLHMIPGNAGEHSTLQHGFMAGLWQGIFLSHTLLADGTTKINLLKEVEIIYPNSPAQKPVMMIFVVIFVDLY
jgi:hypothetical protein